MESLSTTVLGSEFHTEGAEQRKARFASAVLDEDWDSDVVADRRLWTWSRSLSGVEGTTTYSVRSCFEQIATAVVTSPESADCADGGIVDERCWCYQTETDVGPVEALTTHDQWRHTDEWRSCRSPDGVTVATTSTTSRQVTCPHRASVDRRQLTVRVVQPAEYQSYTYTHTYIHPPSSS